MAAPTTTDFSRDVGSGDGAGGGSGSGSGGKGNGGRKRGDGGSSPTGPRHRGPTRRVKQRRTLRNCGHHEGSANVLHGITAGGGYDPGNKWADAQGMPNQTGFGPLNDYYIGCCNTLPNDGFWARFSICAACAMLRARIRAYPHDAIRNAAEDWVQNTWQDPQQREVSERPSVFPYIASICPVCSYSFDDAQIFIQDMEDHLKTMWPDGSLPNNGSWGAIRFDFGWPDEEDDGDDDGAGGGGGGGRGGGGGGSGGGGGGGGSGGGGGGRGNGYGYDFDGNPIGASASDSTGSYRRDAPRDFNIARRPTPPNPPPPDNDDTIDWLREAAAALPAVAATGGNDEDDDSSQDASYCESERCDENEESEKTTTEEADDREERHVHINLSEIQMPAWENVVYDRAEWAAMLGRIDIQAQ